MQDFVVNNCNLMYGDCLVRMTELPDSSIQMVLADLPYGTTRNKWDICIDLTQMWNELLRITTEHACIALWSQEPFTTSLIISQPEIFRYKWIVEKTNATGFLNARRMPLKSYEELLIFYRKLPTYHPQKTTGHCRKVSTSAHHRHIKEATTYNTVVPNTYDSTERFPRDIVTFAWDTQKSALHPTQKPIAALEYFIRTYTQEGDTVLDMTMGSGSTGVACINTGRNFVGIENNEHYYETACNRISKVL